MPNRHRIGIHQIRTDPPVATVDVNFFFCGNMTVVFTCKPIHFEDDFFRATQLDHRLSEPCVTDKSTVNVFILFLSTPLFELFCRVEFFATFFLPVPVTVWPALPDVESSGWRTNPARMRCTSCFLSCHLVRSARTCCRRMPASQYAKHALHCAFHTVQRSQLLQSHLLKCFSLC